MRLTLEVVNEKRATLGERARRSFVDAGGVIGRTADNDWVLASGGVSRHHATIRFINGIFFVEDHSQNGSVLNGSPMAKNEPMILSDGDRLLIDVFEIAVTTDASDAPLTEAIPPDPIPDDPIPAARPRTPTHTSMLDEPLFAPGGGLGHGDSLLGPDAGLIPDDQSFPVNDPASDALDPLALLGGSSSGSSSAPIPPSRPWAHTDAVHDQFKAPQPLPPLGGGGGIPDDWGLDSTASEAASAPPRASASPARPAPARPRPDDVRRGGAAASRPATPPPATAPAAKDTGATPAVTDRVLRIVIDGMIELLRARAEIKSEFRLPVTRAQRTENNPLKFAADADDAMHNLFERRNPAYLGPIEAFEDALSDLRLHQMAMLAGARAAYESMLQHFDPQRLLAEFEQAPPRKGDLLNLLPNQKRWKQFELHFADLQRDPDDSFRSIFGDAFARAYEAELARNARKGTKP